MSTDVSKRPARRAATRSKVVLDDSDEENVPLPKDDGSEDEFALAPQRSPRRQTRRKTADISQTPRAVNRTLSARTMDDIDHSIVMEADPEPLALGASSPSKRTSPKKRKSNVSAKGRQSVVHAEPVAPMPKLMPMTELKQESNGSQALSDITSTANNDQSQAVNSQKCFVPVKALDTVLERPMDIVIRSRALPVPVHEPDVGPKARTVIKNLVLINFKSYAGRQEVGPFHASFSSVVGPNGSGKSNVIDSLLFVFGFRASKMRQGKISALIHNSSAYPDLDHCEVEVHFEEVMDLPDGRHETQPDSTLIVSRKAFKNNSSKYYINMRESNFTDVTSLLKGKGVDLDHKRFLILQGEVESIAQMKPKAANEHDDGLLEYLEDIIGTSKYKSPIDESATEVDTLNEVCTEKSARVQHVEKERDGLEDKKSKALAYIKDENNLATKQSSLYQVYIDECEDNLKVTDEAISQMQENLDAEIDKHQGNEDGIKTIDKAYKTASRELEDLQKATQSVIKEMAKHDKEHVKYEEKKKFLRSKQLKQEKSLQTARLASSEAQNNIQKHNDDITRNTKETSKLEEILHTEERELSQIREGLKGKTQAFSNQIAAKQKALEPWNEKINVKLSLAAVAQSELEILRTKAAAGDVAIAEARSKILSLEQAQQAKLGHAKELHLEREAVEKDVAKAQAQVASLAERESQLRSKLSGARQGADEARASLASSQSQGNVLTGLMRLKESGRIDGFHGRLGNLGVIDQKYDVAISTACPALDNLVVDTVEVGQQCIDYLRKNNLGRANVILLDRLARRDLSPIDTPEKVPRLFDLVKAKHDVFRPAFFSVLQNTLVAEDLKQANRIAYGAKRWRVVTLDGQLIDVSGTMSGGGTRVAKGGMSSKLVSQTSKEQVAKLEVDRDHLEALFNTHQENVRNLEQSLNDLTSQLPKLETAISKNEMECASLTQELADANRRIDEISSEQSSSSSDDARINVLEKQVAKLEKEIAKLRTETSGLEEEIKSLQDKIMEVGGIRLRAQKAKVDGLKEQSSMLTEEISNAEIARSKAEKQKVKHEKSFESLESELTAVAKELEALSGEARNQSEDATGSKRKVEEAQQALEEKKDDLAALKQEFDDKTASLNESRAVEIDMRNKLEENQKVQSENQKRHRYWNDKLDKLTIQSVDDRGEEQEPQEMARFTKDELQDMDKDVLKGEIAVLEERIQNVNVELGVLAEYRRRVEEHASRSSDLQSAVSSRDAAKKRCDELRKLRLEGFMTGFSIISLRLKEMYQMITMGGNAELELVDSLDPFSEGILFSVMPPKKSWKNISNLSGGEKTLSSLALVFALHHYKPTPLYVMDEIDAALDFRNVSIVASYIKERTKNAQFIVISLRNNMFELASRLVGVYKVNHMTKSVTVENRDYIGRGA